MLSAYTLTEPEDTDLEGDGALAIRTQAELIKERVELDHNFDGILDTTLATADGYHNKVTLPEKVTDPTLLSAVLSGNPTFSYGSTSVGTATMTIASPCVVTKSTHGLITGDTVYFTTTGALPTGLTASTPYYVIYIDANTFNLSDTYLHSLAGTGKINTSGSQSGTHTLLKYDKVIVTKSTHGLVSGNNVFFTTTGTLPSPLVASTTYYVNKIDDNTYYLCYNYDDAIAGTYRIATTSAGSGTHTASQYTCGILYSKSDGLYFRNFAGIVKII